MSNKKKEHDPGEVRTQSTLREKYTTLLNELQPYSQCWHVLNHMMAFGSITSIEAFETYRITRVAARIHDLRQKYGADIDTETVVKKRNKAVIKFGRYILK